jgi:biopolymer transport protein ExbD
VPSSSTGEVEKRDFAEISVARDGKIFFNKREVSLSDLLLLVTSLYRESPDTKIIISGDRGTSYETIVSILDIIRKSGMKKVSLETRWK